MKKKIFAAWILVLAMLTSACVPVMGSDEIVFEEIPAEEGSSYVAAEEEWQFPEAHAEEEWQLPDEPAGEFLETPADEEYVEEPGEEYVEEPGEVYAEEPGEVYAEEPGEEYVEEPSEVYAEEPGEVYAEEPDEPYTVEPDEVHIEEPDEVSDEVSDEEYDAEFSNEYGDEYIDVYSGEPDAIAEEGFVSPDLSVEVPGDLVGDGNESESASASSDEIKEYFRTYGGYEFLFESATDGDLVRLTVQGANDPALSYRWSMIRGYQGIEEPLQETGNSLLTEITATTTFYCTVTDGDTSNTYQFHFETYQNCEPVTESRSFYIDETLSIRLEGAVGEVTFESLDPDIAVVDENGIISGVAGGDAKIRMTVPATELFRATEKTYTVHVMKRNQPLTLSTPKSTLMIGESMPVTADGAAGEVTFSSEDPAIAEVGPDGSITGKSAGYVLIWASCPESDYYNGASTSIRIQVAKYAQTLNLSLPKASMLAGDSMTLMTDGSIGELTFSSEDPNVATVDENGVITGVSPGMILITVTAAETDLYKEVVKSITVLIANRPQPLTVSVPQPSLYVGENMDTLVEDAEGELTFSSEDPSVATVDEAGVITGVTGGTTKITVTASGNEVYAEGSKTFTIRVLKMAQTLTAGIPDSKLFVSETAAVDVTGAETALTYTSEDPSVASVSSKGIVTGKSAGTVRLTVKAAETAFYKEGSRTFTIRVLKKSQTLTASIPDSKVYVAKTAAVTVSGAKTALSYRSDNTAVAAVNSKGVVTGKSAGTARITVTAAETGLYNKAERTFTIRVIKSAQPLAAKAAAGTLAVGRTTAISVTGASGKLTYVSSNPAVATVTSTGKVTAKKVGMANIRVEATETAAVNFARVSVPVTVVPEATSSFAAENQADGIRLLWTRVPGAAGYDIFKNGKKITTVKGAVKYTDTKAKTNDTTYKYKIVAYAVVGGKERRSPLSKSLSALYLKAPAITSLIGSAPLKVTARWTKNAKAAGYELEFALTRSFTAPLKKSIAKNTTLKTVMTGFQKGRTYYARIRAYKKVSGKKVYSAWSAVKSLRIKM